MKASKSLNFKHQLSSDKMHTNHLIYNKNYTINTQVRETERQHAVFSFYFIGHEPI